MFLDTLRKGFDFYCTGFDSGFSFYHMNLVWKMGRMAGVDDPSVLFWSLPAINKSIAEIVSLTTSIGTINTPKIQKFLQSLYAYRSKIELDPPLRKGWKNTYSMRNGQRLRIVLPSHGVFSSILLANTSKLTISYPIPAEDKYHCFDWRQKRITVYFWRKNDAGYVFDTNVTGVGHYQGRSVLFIEHSQSLQRSQKRKSIRCPCSIMAELYLLYDNSITDMTAVEEKSGIKCVLEDLSEDGALIRIGGCGQEGMPIKIQFMLGNNPIVMSGSVKSVEYNKTINQSRLHFQASNIAESVRQKIALYVYSIIPEEQKHEFDAIKLMEDDEELPIEKNLEKPEDQNLEVLEAAEEPVI
ncbi:MAG: PilZ domain-containing protein [Spirochaetaceae bacterium]|nr:PilZ domain-containing protein [Spirochaetaceae bacterium]MBO7486318.1 PilZ domain-containing protein [Spirochaetaceae bacterium]MBP5329790.1 PilZ domain-containing protein [Spirochaetaceae bacterium]